MPIDTLYAQNTTIINATYDKVFVAEIVIAAELNGDAQARVLLRKFRSTESGAEIFNAENEMSTRLAALMAANDNPENQITVVYSDRPAVVSLNGV